MKKKSIFFSYLSIDILYKKIDLVSLVHKLSTKYLITHQQRVSTIDNQVFKVWMIHTFFSLSIVFILRSVHAWLHRADVDVSFLH